MKKLIYIGMVHIGNDIQKKKPMKVFPIDSIQSITPISPIKIRKQQIISGKRKEIISDKNLGKNVDITLKGPLKAPDCIKCVSYYVTWDSNFPHGCKKFKFKRGMNYLH